MPSTITIACPCSASLTLATGFTADAMTAEQKERIARAKRWNADPPICPRCIELLFVCHECGTRADLRDDPKNSAGACKNCGSHKWTEGKL